jgi:glycosyltransferase involved in cell wall biosynthesis
MGKPTLGVSVVICCHNSMARLPQTLAHLAMQQIPGDAVPWEVIVIDNGSTDQTAKIARQHWPTTVAPLRVVAEPQLGLIHARRCGLAAARFELVSFVDDNNWVCPQWITTVAELMSQHPEVGACGGPSVAVSDGELPAWFARHGGVMRLVNKQPAVAI